jgi:hypothetical protein
MIQAAEKGKSELDIHCQLFVLRGDFVCTSSRTRGRSLLKGTGLPEASPLWGGNQDQEETELQWPGVKAPVC